MATPQRQFPNEPPRREPKRVERRTATPPARSGGRSLFWIWIVLFIAAIIWFAGWGFGGYGGWWWGRTHGPTITQPTNRGTGAGGTGTAVPGGSTGANDTAAPRGGAAPQGGHQR